jgi:DNA-binding SARP family transcriptional activator
MVTKYLSLPKSTFQEAPFVTRLGEYIARGEYQCAVDMLLECQPITPLGPNILGECLIQSARQLCVAALQTQADIEHHRKSLDMAVLRRAELDDEIRAFIKLIAVVFETEHRELPRVSPISLSSVFPGEFRPTSSPSNTIVQLSKLSPVIETKVVTAEVDTLHEADYRLEVYTLGSFQVYFNGELVENWSSRKGTHIFKYLLFNREHPIHKEVLMEQFWPDSDAEAQRNNLNVAIYGLRQVLRDNDSEFSHVLFQNDCYFLNPDMDIWLDADAFSKRYQAAQKLAKQGDMSAAVTEYAAAEMLYEGLFLPEDTYEEWTESLRQRLEMEYLDTLDQLSRQYLETNDYAACANMCQKMIAAEACSEDAHARLMRCYRRQGQIHLALRQYDRCVKLLDSELDIEPSDELTSLYEKIRAGEII